MAINLSNIQPAAGATKHRKEIGRGGKRGSYSGKGMKGQRARSGVSGLKALGLRQMMLSTPKLRGFKSIYAKIKAINVGDLEVFNDGDIVDLHKLIQKGLIDKSCKQYKVLGSGKLTKKLVVAATGFTGTAQAAIEKAGGKVQVR